MMQGQRDLVTLGTRLLSELAPLVNAQQGMIYQMEGEGASGLTLLSAFADDGRDGHRQHIQVGEGLIGQCAAEKRSMLITDLPSHTIPIRSGLFQAVPRNIIVLPVLFEDQVKAVIELASLSAFTASHLAFLEQLTASIGIVLNSIEATMQTEGLLKQSQQLAAELQAQQTELQQTNEQLAQKAQQLAEQNVEVERKNQEIEQARRALEEPPARRRSSSGSTARTAPARCSPPVTRSPGCSARSPRCCRSVPATRPHWPVRWAAPPTPSRSSTSTRPCRRWPT
jgi:GAF domain-containing protein